MSNADVRQLGELIETTELLRRIPCSRNVLTRLRREYGMIQPVRTIGHGLHLWDPRLVETIKGILEGERR